MSQKQTEIQHNKFLRKYLTYVEDTESPRLFHIWAAISAVAACIGRKAWLEFGPHDIYPNMYIALVGPAGVRKSVTISYTSKLLKETAIKFGPTDTGGQHQGLLAALENDDDAEEEELIGGMASGDVMGFLKGEVSADELKPKKKISLSFGSEEAQRDPATVYIAAGEMNNFIGINAPGLINCLTHLWDNPEDYTYKLKSSKIRIQNPCINIITGTTPTNLAHGLPPASIGQGFTSRMIFVYAQHKYKSIPRPSRPDPELTKELSLLFQNIEQKISGPFRENEQAGKLIDELYETTPRIDDARFDHYYERRQAHMLKLCMCLAAADLRTTITRDDVELANALLLETEKDMSHALGEFGLSAVSEAKQKTLEAINSQSSTISQDALFAIMRREYRTRMEFNNAIGELISAGSIAEINTHDADGNKRKELVSMQRKRKKSIIEKFL